VITDSVVLGAKPALFKSLSDWKITFEGRPALMVKTAVGEIKRSGQMMPPVAVVALGYNSLWEKDRKHFERWAEKFDREAESMIALLTSRGAKKVVWVMLRELTPELVTKKGMRQYKKAAWYFPYVNERLKALCEKHPELALADWPSASQELGLTYDAIHLNTKGAKVMVDVIRAAIGLGPTPPEEKKK
jgi:lysophospholipase L1-like esterase